MSMTGNAFAGGFLDRSSIVAKAGFNRWLVPPAALAIHLCIGMSYGLSVFWLPLAKVIPGDAPAECKDLGWFGALFTTTCNWRVSDLVVTFTIGIVVLGISAALFGGWLERVGPRKAALVAALCWAGGFLIGAFGVMIHQLWVIWLGLGLIGGIGLGLGYISPVSTLVKWFPDRRGMATGMAIMGFGGGAMIGSPLANILMNGGDLFPFLHLSAPLAKAPALGPTGALVTLGLGYLAFMLGGAFSYRVAPDNWAPAGWSAPVSTNSFITRGYVALEDAHKTPQFWMVWIVLCMNVSAGIGVLAMASPMLQEIFGGGLIGLPDVGFKALDKDQLVKIAGIAAGFVGLLSLFNIAGRFFWASLSDRIGRKTTYFIFFVLGIALYAATPTLAHGGLKGLFVATLCVILSMYGGGFATVPAYLADLFGAKFVGAIHGRLLTAWSTAGVVGPLLVAQIRQSLLNSGIEPAHAYDFTLYILAGLLVVGLIANAMIGPVAPNWLKADDGQPAAKAVAASASDIGSGGAGIGLILAWLVVGIPILWGVAMTLNSAVKIFQ